MQTRNTARTPPQARQLHQSICPQSQENGFRLRQSGLKPQTAIQPKHNAPIRESHVLLEHYSLVCPRQGLQIDSRLVSVNG